MIHVPITANCGVPGVVLGGQDEMKDKMLVGPREANILTATSDVIVNEGDSTASIWSLRDVATATLLPPILLSASSTSGNDTDRNGKSHAYRALSSTVQPHH